MTTYLGKSCSFCLPRVPFVNCRQFMYLVISLLVLRAGYGIWLYQFLIIAYLFTLHSLVRGPWGVNMSSIWQNIVTCMDVLYFHCCIFSTDSATYFLTMRMLISSVGTLTQARMGVGRVTFLSKGPMSICLPYDKIRTCHRRFLFQLLFPQTQSVSYFLKMIMLISLVGTLTQARMGTNRMTFLS